jgi:hypothetical protein
VRPTTHQHVVSTATDGLAHAGACRLERVVIGTEVAAQTLAIHDVAAAADVAAGNLVCTIKLDTRGSFDFGLDLRAGLVTVLSGGAPDIAVIFA